MLNIKKSNAYIIESSKIIKKYEHIMLNFKILIKKYYS